MPGGLQTTFAVLAKSGNEAAVAALLAALDSPLREIREGALAALLCRHSEQAENEILNRWDGLSDRWKHLVAERAGWISGAVRRALAESDPPRYRAACEAAVCTRDFDLMPLLATAAADPANSQREGAAKATLQLAELLADELAAPRDYRVRRDPRLQCQHVLGSLERVTVEFQRHSRLDLVEAFLLLADRENAALKRILQAPDDRSFAPLAELLAGSSRWGVQRLLLSFLDDPHAPLAALNLIARRHDVAFVRLLTRKIGADPSAVVRGNLRRLEAISWLDKKVKLLDALHEAEQPGAVRLAALSGVPRSKAFDVVAYVLRHGKLAGRRAAAQALVEFQSAAADELVLRTLEDDDPQVRAAAARQLRGRAVPGPIHRLLPLLDSPHQCEREAAQASLEEFHFERFLASFDELPDEIRKSAGPLVRRIDASALGKLRQELEAPTRSRRQRGLQLAIALGAVHEVLDSIAALLKDDDQYLRLDAVRALATSENILARQALREALSDSHPFVQREAEAALARLATGLEPQAAPLGISSGSDCGPIDVPGLPSLARS